MEIKNVNILYDYEGDEDFHRARWQSDLNMERVVIEFDYKNEGWMDAQHCSMELEKVKDREGDRFSVIRRYNYQEEKCAACGCVTKKCEYLCYLKATQLLLEEIYRRGKIK
jgi:hypothetical protein